MSRCDFKIVLLGSEHVGKTCLVVRFIQYNFTATPYQNTIGVVFCSKAVQSGGRTFNVGVWDTAGSERFEAMSRQYYRGAHAAIICYDPASLASWRRLRYWLAEVRSVEEKCKVYLCSTKKDLLDAGVVTRAVDLDTVASYSLELAGHFHTSSKTGENVEELFQRVVDDLAADVGVIRAVDEQRVSLQLSREAARRARARGCAC